MKDFIRDGAYLEDLLQLGEELDSIVGLFIVSNCIRSPTNGMVRCPTLLKRFYQSLYKWISPACTVAPAGTWPVLEKIILHNRLHFSYFPLIADQSPVLADICTYITTLSGNAERYDMGIDLLDHILETAKNCFRSPKPNYQNPIRPVSEQERVLYASATQEVLETGAYFPGRPYHSVVKDIHLSNEAALCNKLYKKKGRLGAGTLLFWCGVHRKCLGFYIMQSAESCKTVFQILATRFPKQPRVIIYDNGCNLSEYVLNRAPVLFKDTYILSDGFHWKNHTNCSVAYNSKLYPALNSNLI
jgi:hypothetical protein